VFLGAVCLSDPIPLAGEEESQKLGMKGIRMTARGYFVAGG
jgi:hypothetical protein